MEIDLLARYVISQFSKKGHNCTCGSGWVSGKPRYFHPCSELDYELEQVTSQNKNVICDPCILGREQLDDGSGPGPIKMKFRSIALDWTSEQEEERRNIVKSGRRLYLEGGGSYGRTNLLPHHPLN